MTTLAATHPTLLDLAKRQNPDGKIADIVEILNIYMPELQDMTFVEGNLQTGHKTTVRTGVPAPTWRKMYGGVQPTKSTTAQITDTCGMLEAYAEIDKALAELNGNEQAWRLSEEKPFIEGFAQEIASTLWYGNEGTEPEAFTGFTPRYNAKSGFEASSNVISANDSTTPTDNNSIWLIGWGPNTIHGIIPKGSVAGLQHRDLGEVTIENVDGANGRMQAYRSHYRQDVGLTVRDWRYAVRICNISKALLTVDAATGPNLPNLMFQALEQIQSLEGVMPVFYMPRTLQTKLRQQTAAAVKNSSLTIENVGGVKQLMSFNGVPVKRTDSLAADEAYVS